MSTLTPSTIGPILERLRKANGAYAGAYPGESPDRQPVHTVYGGAHLFKADSARKLGELGLRSLRENAPNFCVLARAIGLRGSETLPDTQAGADQLRSELERDSQAVRRTNEPAWLAHTIYSRVESKLAREAVEDFRIDFEDGFGNRSDAEEDDTARSCAAEVARGMREGTLSPFIGIRIKPFSGELHTRATRTLDLFLTDLVRQTGGKLPANFVVTQPKVVSPDQTAALIDMFEILERSLGLPPGSLKMELMIETTQSIFDSEGRSNLPRLLAAARGRCVAAHFGVYDYTACCTITAEHQKMGHPACDFARHMMQVAFAGTGVFISDGATNIMPVGPHRAPPGGSLSAQQAVENRAVVHRAWKLHFDDVRHSLSHAFYQGWDLNPAQLPTRYAALYSFFLEGLESAGQRLSNFISKAAQATLVGDVFDDAATGQGLLNFFLRGLNCGAITESEALATGLTIDELRSRSFVKILAGRRK